MKIFLILAYLFFSITYYLVLKFVANDKKNNAYSMNIYSMTAYAIAGLIIGGTYFIHNPFFYEHSLWFAFGAGFLAVLGNLPYLMCLPKAPGSVVMPLMGMIYPCVAIGGILLFHEPITPKVIVGIVAGAVAIYLFNS